jgi:hypothetical protein
MDNTNDELYRASLDGTFAKTCTYIYHVYGKDGISQLSPIPSHLEQAINDIRCDPS